VLVGRADYRRRAERGMTLQYGHDSFSNAGASHFATLPRRMVRCQPAPEA
jgi:hypothetical protein